MKIVATGVVRKIDELGRIVIPKEVRKRYEMEEGTPMEIFTTDTGIFIQKYQRACIFCHNITDTVMYEDRLICKECIDKLNEMAQQ